MTMWTHTRSSGRRGPKGGRTGGATGDAVIDAAGFDAGASFDGESRDGEDDAAWFGVDQVQVDTEEPMRGDDRVAEVHELYGERDTENVHRHAADAHATRRAAADHADRKSTRLNSSHVKISYAVFCL